MIQNQEALHLLNTWWDFISLIQKMKTHSTQSEFIMPSVWAAAVTLIRSSVILLYIRIFPTRPFRLTCYTILIFNTAFFIAAVLNTLLYCIPIWCLLDTAATHCHCGSPWSPLLNAFFNLLLDITVVLLPMSILWGLKMVVGRKAALSGMFGLGFA